MNTNLQNSIKKYLGETLGIQPSFSGWKDSTEIPYTIRSEYDFSEIRLLGQDLIAISAKGETQFSASKLAKHLAWMDTHCSRTGVFIATGLEAYNRKRLIEQKVPFIISGNQLYLPDLGIDLREHLRKVREEKPKLSPSTQVVLLAHLLGKFTDMAWTATHLAEKLKLSKMTMSRAMEEMESHELIEVGTEGREKRMHFIGGRQELWEKAQSVLRSPVQKRVFVENVDWSPGITAGLSALSAQTMITTPAPEVRALSGQAWKNLNGAMKLKIVRKASADLARVEFEVWKYDPNTLSENDQVDPLSLYLSLTDTKDERVEGELGKLLKGIKC